MSADWGKRRPAASNLKRELPLALNPIHKSVNQSIRQSVNPPICQSVNLSPSPLPLPSKYPLFCCKPSEHVCVSSAVWGSTLAAATGPTGKKGNID